MSNEELTTCGNCGEQHLTVWQCSWCGLDICHGCADDYCCEERYETETEL